MTTPFIEFAKQHLPDGAVGAEVGVRAGTNAIYLLDNLNLKKLYLVDNFKEYVDTDGVYPQKLQDEIFVKLVDIMEAISLFREFEGKIEIVKMDSLRAADKMENGSLDFVYIDANHSYEYIKEDLNAWKDKVKAGGIIGGHDYNYPGTQTKKAIDEFAIRNKYNLTVLEPRAGDVYGIEWAIIKK